MDALRQAEESKVYQDAAVEAAGCDFDELLDRWRELQNAIESAIWAEPSKTEIEPAMQITITGRRSVFDLFAEGHDWDEAERLAEIETTRTIELPECPAGKLPECDLPELQSRRDAFAVAIDTWEKGLDANLTDEEIQNDLLTWAESLRSSPREVLPTLATFTPPTFPAFEGEPGPLPRHLLEVPGLVSEVAEFSLSTAKRRQPLLSLFGAIALLATLIGRKMQDIYGTRSNLQIITVVESGAGKDQPRGINSEILIRAQLDKLEGPEEVASDAGLFKMLSEHEVRLWQCDEFGRFLATTGNARSSPHLYAIPSALMRLYTSAGKLFRPKAYGDSKHNLTIDQPCLILYGTSTPDALYAALSADTISDGFLGRCLIVEGQENPQRQMIPKRPIPEDIMARVGYWGQYRAGDGNLEDRHPEPFVVPSTLEARIVFEHLANAIDRNRRSKDRGSALWARTEEKANQLALVYACSANPEQPIIDGAAASWAAEMSYRLTARMVYLASIWVSSNEQESKQQKVLRLIKAAGKISQRDLSRKTQWLKSRERQEILNGMYEAGMVRQIEQGTKTKPLIMWESCQ